MKEITIYTSTLNKQGYDYLKEVFNFPDYFGNNLDALYDCLSDHDDLLIRIIWDEGEVPKTSAIFKVIKIYCENSSSIYTIDIISQH